MYDDETLDEDFKENEDEIPEDLENMPEDLDFNSDEEL